MFFTSFIQAVLLDEVHLGGHWAAGVSPELLRQVLNVRVHAEEGAPIAGFTATITEEELRIFQDVARRRKPSVVIAEGPVQRHSKVCAIPRPPSQVPFFGDTDSQGVFQPGILHLLKLLVLDRFIAAFKDGNLASFPKTIIFFRGSWVMGLINSFLRNETGELTCATAPWAMVHSALSSSSKATIKHRREQIFLYLTSDHMLLDASLPDARHIVFVRPPKLEHTVVQAMSRSGPLLPSGERQTSLVTMLYNAKDLDAKGISEGMKKLCESKTRCLKEILRSMFVGDYSVDLIAGSSLACCSVCDTLVAKVAA